MAYTNETGDDIVLINEALVVDDGMTRARVDCEWQNYNSASSSSSCRDSATTTYNDGIATHMRQAPTHVAALCGRLVLEMTVGATSLSSVSFSFFIHILYFCYLIVLSLPPSLPTLSHPVSFTGLYISTIRMIVCSA